MGGRDAGVETKVEALGMRFGIVGYGHSISVARPAMGEQL